MLNNFIYEVYELIFNFSPVVKSLIFIYIALNNVKTLAITFLRLKIKFIGGYILP